MCGSSGPLSIDISATVPIGTPGRVWGIVWLSDELAACLACFKGLTLRLSGLVGVRCVPVFHTYFLHDNWSQMCRKLSLQNH